MARRMVIGALGCVLALACGDDGSSATASGSDSDSATGPDSDSDSGTGSEPDMVNCEVIELVGVPSPGSEPNPEQRRTVTGENGTLSDECDQNGNLLEYVCEVVTECGPGPNPECNNRQTGDVVPQMFDCAGGCVDGTCVARCPEEGDPVGYVEVAGVDVILENGIDGRRYDCLMSFDQANEPYDCTNDPAVGDNTLVFGLGLMSQWCTGTQAFNIGTSMDGQVQQCTYMCTMVP